MSPFAGISTGSRRTANMLAVALALSIAAGLFYPLLDAQFGLIGAIALKGLGVSALAVAALLSRGPDAKWLTAIMAAGAIGDILLAVPGAFIFGGSAFAIGHCCAIGLYLRRSRTAPPLADRFRAAALVAWGLVMPSLVMPAGTPVGALMLYSVLLCGMAAAALLSRFPRHLVALGALLFVVSDTFLIMRLGGRIVGGDTLHGLIVWYSYYAGQLLIFLGIARSPEPA